VKTDTKIQEELRVIAPWLANLPKRNPFTTPVNYFENTKDTFSNINLQNESPAAWTLVSKISQFGVPQDYFDTLTSRIIIAINKSEKKTEPVFNKTTSFIVPEGYFDLLPEAILNQVPLHSENEVEHMSHSQKKSFGTPEGYFNNLPDSVLAKINRLPETRVISLKGWVKQSKYIIGVAATVLAIVFGINHLHTDVSNSLTESELTAQEISEYLNDNPEEYDEQILMQKVAEKNISEEHQAVVSDQEALKQEIETSLLDELDESTLNQSL